MSTLSVEKSQANPQSAAAAKLPLSTKLIYGSADLVGQLVWTFVSSYLAVFYTDVVGLSAAVASMILLGARVWDAVNDPMLGAIAERTKSKHGRFRPYIIYGTPFLVIVNVLCFTAPGFDGNMTAKIVWATVTYILLGMLYTVINIPVGALGIVMSYDPVERTELQSYRMVGIQLGAVVLNIIAMPLILFFIGVGDGQTMTGRGFTMTAIVFGIITVPVMYFMVSRCKEVVKPVYQDKKVPLSQTVKVVLRNKPLIAVFLMLLFTMTAYFGRMAVAVYYYMYLVQRFDLIAVFMPMPALFTVIGVLAATKFIDKVGKKKMCVISYLSSAAILVALYFTDYTNIPVLLVLTMLYGLSSFAFSVPMAMVPEAIDYMEDKTGVRSDGTTSAFTSLGVKLASAIGSAAGVALLGVFGFVANAQQSEATLRGINMVVNLLPAGFYILAIPVVLSYSLTPEKCAEIRGRLHEKAKKESDANG